MKRAPSKDDDGTQDDDGQLPNFGVQLRKPAERKPRSFSESGGPEPNFRSLLRKPRTKSTGDMLDDEDTSMDKDLLQLMKKRKAAAERGKLLAFSYITGFLFMVR